MKYDGTYCCGHRGTITLFGPGKERDRKYQWIFSQYCPDCQRKFREEQNDRAVQESMERELPELSGTEKQVAWANTLRLNKIDRMYADLDSLDPSYTIQIEDRVYNKAGLLELIHGILLNATKARFWIDVRDLSSGHVIKKAFKEGILSSKVPEEVAEEIEDEKAALTARPENPSKAGLVVIGVERDRVTARYIKDDDFRRIAKEHRFRWAGCVWQHSVGEFSGPADDLAAALGNALLAAGYTVQFFNQAQMDMAVAGIYTPECTRWIKYSSDYDDLGIQWDGHNDTLYQAALTLPGAKYRDGVVHVRAEYYDQILDFADTLQFKVSKKALDRIQAYRDSERHFVTVSVSVPETDSQPDEDRIKRSLVKDGTILEDLRDDT